MIQESKFMISLRYLAGYKSNLAGRIQQCNPLDWIAVVSLDSLFAQTEDPYGHTMNR